MIPAGIINLENGQMKNAIWYFEYPYVICKTADDEEIIRMTDNAFRQLLTAYCESNPSNVKK